AAQSVLDSPNAGVYARAQELVGSGEGDAGRAVVDSMLAAARAGTPEYAEALFWRAAFARTAAEAERDYLRVSVEYPTSPYAEDALLRLGMLELSRGDRRRALQRFESLVLRYPTGRQRPRAQYWIGRTYFDDNRIAEGCTALSAARGATPGDAVELRTQIDYYAQRCRGVQPAAASSVAGVGAPPSGNAAASPQPSNPVSPAPRPTTPAQATSPAPTTSATPTTTSAPTTSRTSAPAAVVTYSVQVAAFPQKANADRYA